MKNWKRFLAALLSLLLVMGMAACGNTEKEEESPAETEAAMNPDYRVALITDSHDVDDHSFNQTTYEACAAFCNDHHVTCTYKKPDKNTDESRIQMVDSAVAEGYNVLLLPGYLSAKTVDVCSKKYPDVKFIAIDVSADDLADVRQNVYCASYAEEIPGYLAGYAAVRLGYKKLGFLGGMPLPSVVRYGYGYLQGINDAAASLDISDEIEVEFAYSGGFEASRTVIRAMNEWYEKGTEVVFSCGGGVFASVAEAAKAVNGKVIGVDTDQSISINHFGKDMAVTSAVKGLSVTVLEVLDAIILKDQWETYAGKAEVLGLVSGEDLSRNYVGLPDSTHFTWRFTRDDYKSLVQNIYEGKILIQKDVLTAPNVTVSVNFRDGTIE